MIVGLFAVALATDAFDPTAPEAVYTEGEVFTLDGATRLWSAIELHTDDKAELFDPDQFNRGTEWPAADDELGFYAPWIRECFGTARPASGSFLLHIGPTDAISEGTPILFVPGAGDNGSRGFITMASRMDRNARPVYAITFAHPHGDVFEQAEVVADAIARIKVRTGASKVDIVSHSKGGIATAVYLSHGRNAPWGDAGYETHGTAYRDDVRRAVFIASPLGGVDTSYRWTNNNLFSLDAQKAISPSSWSSSWYGSNILFATDMTAQDFLPEDGDMFPGQRQLLARQDYELPGERADLGAYAVQVDWYTTYEGGVGFWSMSDGIDAAIEAGGDLINKLALRGVDPDVELFLLAGDHPVMPNGNSDWLSNTIADQWGEAWGSISAMGSSTWNEFVADLVDDGFFEDVALSTEELDGVSEGKLVLGEVTGPSDGLVFVTSATKAEALTARGAVVKETKIAHLSHLDLLYASPITGDLLVQAGQDGSEEDQWMIGVGNRYTREDTLGWVERVLADPEPTDTDETDAETDTDAPTTDDEDPGETPDPDDLPDDVDGVDPGAKVCSCASSGGAWLPAAALAALVIRRRRAAR
jgi:MYXO-CTERM domain-containing protein